MNLSLMSLEVCVVALGLIVLLADLWLPVERKRALGCAAAAALGLLLIINFAGCGSSATRPWRRRSIAPAVAASTGTDSR